ncbi:TPM domain-containing protein [Mannheimia sp. AT1]|uniref:TPM domain-containing protein n=1 Tax=Mannheimia cairinae TaxID=3025936 RepID=A0ABT5MKZ8_9PAST|nr:TPM domain-containing protein [Mannheimia cairinae]MDD0822865.1 TPM domain-containing protein [Mannheimia cairinae]MDD0826107.1 TPM domain-containing protein [Mannheimia cairinae]
MGLFSFLSNTLPVDTDIIEQAIAHLETQTSAELRVVVERKAKIENVEDAAVLRATQLFDELKMYETAERNGVLIYLSFKPHYVAVIGDEGIHQKVGDDFWQKIYAAMCIACQNGDYTKAICDAIKTVETPLALHFPYFDDKNELSNEVVVK